MIWDLFWMTLTEMTCVLTWAGLKWLGLVLNYSDWSRMTWDNLKHCPKWLGLSQITWYLTCPEGFETELELVRDDLWNDWTWICFRWRDTWHGLDSNNLDFFWKTSQDVSQMCLECFYAQLDTWLGLNVDCLRWHCTWLGLVVKPEIGPSVGQ